MEPTQHKLVVTCAIVATLLLATPIAHAIGPQYQVIGDPVPAGAGTLNDAVSLTFANNSENGTGAVIGVSQPDANGNVCLAILTANHVAISGVTQAQFGVGPGANFGKAGADPNVPGVGPYLLNANLDSHFVTFGLPGAPGGRTEDMSIMVAHVNVNNLAGAALAEYNKVAANSFLLAGYNAANLPAPGTSRNLTGANQIPFTELGYGTAGKYDTANTKYIPSGINADDARRFQNNTVTSLSGNAVQGTYYEPLANWNYAAPSVAGGGASFGGDSGGPYLVGGNASAVDVYPRFVDDTNPPAGLTAGMKTNIPINFTDAEFAVHVLGQSNRVDGSESVGQGASGIPLISTGNTYTGSLDWALVYAANPCLVPEPDSLVLSALGGVSLLLLWYRRRSVGARRRAHAS
jgi:hypothetical protein